MEAQHKTASFYEFSGFRLDVRNRILVRQGKPVDLTPKVFDTLLLLIRNSGRILEKDELLKALWPDSFVEEGNLSQNIFVLRKTLGDDRNGNTLIQTIPRRGYRFVASVKQIEGSAPENGTLGSQASLIADYWNCHSPFRSLQTFEPEDSWLFFGRDQEIQELLERLGRFPVLAVIGNSGCGKSSLVRAGLIPALQSGRSSRNGAQVASWRVAVFRPSGSPFDYLAEVLASQLAPELGLKEHTEFIAECRNKVPSDPAALRNAITALVNATKHEVTTETIHVLLVADQFEEIFTLTTRQQTRESYINALLAATGVGGAVAIHVVLVLRADFYAQCLEHEELSRSLQTNLYNMPRMGPKQLRESMEQRLQMAAAQAEPGLIESLLEDAGTEPGNLALLEHALGQLWDRRGGFGCTLTNEAYSGIGRLRGALGRHADEVYAGLRDDQSKKLAQKIFLELVHLGEEAGSGSSNDTRRRVSKSTLLSLGDPNEVEKLLACLASSRLISTGESEQSAYVEVSHEALIREWPTLREWIATHRDSMRLERRLLQAAQEWEEVKRDPGALLQGARLAQAEEWLSNSANPSFLITEFVQASIAARQEAETKERQIEQRELARQRASVRHFRWFSASLGGLLMIAVATTWFVWKQQLIAESRALAAQAEATLSQDQPAALSMAIRAWQIAHTPEARASITASFPQLLASLQGHTDAILALKLSPDGQRILTASRDATARVWSTTTGQLLLTLSGHSDTVLSAEFSSDGQRILTASSDKTARVWNATNGQLVTILKGHSGSLIMATFSPDGQRVLTAGWDHTARIWNPANGQLLSTLEGHSDGIMNASFSPDGQRIVTASWDKTARVWNAANGRLQIILQGHFDKINYAAFSPDGRSIITASADQTARIWDSVSGRSLATLRGHSGTVWSTQFSPDGQRVVTASADGTARVWSTNHGKLIATLQGHTGIVSRAVFSPDGQRVATCSGDQTGRIWDATSGKLLATLRGHTRAVGSVWFVPDGRRVVTASLDKTARVWNTLSSQLLITLRGHTKDVWSASFSTYGRNILTNSLDKTARVWDAANGQFLARLDDHADGFTKAVFSPDGQRVLTASEDHTARIWNATNGQLLTTLQGHSDFVTTAVFSPDGRSILTASWDKTARVWNANNGQLLTILQGHSGYVTVAEFSPDGQRILTAGRDKTTRVWNSANGQLLVTLQGHSDRVTSARFSPNSQYILTASWDKTARVWNATNGELLIALRGHSDHINDAVFYRDGQRILTVSDDKTARVWNSSSGQVLAIFDGHLGAIWNGLFSQDGQRILTASFDNTARLWNVADGQPLVIFQGHSDTVWHAEFSPDGQRILTASADGTARVFRVVTLSEIAELLAH